MTVEEKANALVEMGMVRLTTFDAQFRVTGAEVAARNLEIATVGFVRGKGVITVTRCEHRDDKGNGHMCEGHQNGHVCYHARAALQMAAKVAGKGLVFYKSRAETEQWAGVAFKMLVHGHEAKAVFGMVV